MTRSDLEHAAELLARAVDNATPSPWRDSTVDGNRYAALVADRVHPDRPYGWGWDYDEGYGGCLVAESLMPQDRRLLAVMRNLVDHLPGLLVAVAQEDPIQVGEQARAIAAAVLDTHRPRRGST